MLAKRCAWAVFLIKEHINLAVLVSSLPWTDSLSLIRHTILTKWLNYFTFSVANNVIERLLQNQHAFMWPISSVSVSFAPTRITFCCWMLKWFATSWPKQDPCMICVCHCHPRLACASFYVSMPSFPSTWVSMACLSCSVATPECNPSHSFSFKDRRCVCGVIPLIFVSVCHGVTLPVWQVPLNTLDDCDLCESHKILILR